MAGRALEDGGPPDGWAGDRSGLLSDGRTVAGMRFSATAGPGSSIRGGVRLRNRSSSSRAAAAVRQATAPATITPATNPFSLLTYMAFTTPWESSTTLTGTTPASASPAAARTAARAVDSTSVTDNPSAAPAAATTPAADSPYFASRF